MPCTTCNVQAPRPMLKKSFENRIIGSQMRKRKTISSRVRNFPNRSLENAKFRILKVTIITPNCQLFGGDIDPSWVTYTSQEPSGNRHESPYAYGNYKVSKPSTHMFQCAAQKNPFNTSAEALSFLLQLFDRSFFGINASGVPRHCGVTLVAPSGNWVFFRKIATSTFLTQTMQKICVMSTSFHSTLVFPQGHCSRDSLACSSAEQGYKDKYPRLWRKFWPSNFLHWRTAQLHWQKTEKNLEKNHSHKWTCNSSLFLQV